MEKASTHANTLREAADQLYHQHNDPALIRAPPYDMNTALDVLQTGITHSFNGLLLNAHTPSFVSKCSVSGTGLCQSDASIHEKSTFSLKRGFIPLLMCKMASELQLEILYAVPEFAHSLAERTNFMS